MLPANNKPFHLSYCTNIHPGENWEELYSSLREYLPQVKARFSPKHSMGVGLRLSAIAAEQLIEQDALPKFKQWLDSEGLYIYTINGFPYGTFHKKKVKQEVYEPDWTSDKRLSYTQQLAEILANLLPEGLEGSISTVPVAYREKCTSDQVKKLAAKNLLRFVHYAKNLEDRCGKTIRLALEPEPACVLEKSDDVVSFFKDYIFLFESQNGESQNGGLKAQDIHRYLGICLDTCHSTVMFEDPLEFLSIMQKENIPVYKIQLTTALKVPHWKPDLLIGMQAFAEPTYLHQSCIRARDNSIRFYVDLPQALAAVQEEEELRSHFHVPVFAEHMEDVMTTQSDLLPLLQAIKQNKLNVSHLELETYTFDVLPKSLVLGSVVDNICRELQWMEEQLT